MVVLRGGGDVQNGPLNFGKKRTRLRNKVAKNSQLKMALLGHPSFKLA